MLLGGPKSVRPIACGVAGTGRGVSRRAPGWSMIKAATSRLRTCPSELLGSVLKAFHQVCRDTERFYDSTIMLLFSYVFIYVVILICLQNRTISNC